MGIDADGETALRRAMKPGCVDIFSTTGGGGRLAMWGLFDMDRFTRGAREKRWCERVCSACVAAAVGPGLNLQQWRPVRGSLP